MSYEIFFSDSVLHVSIHPSIHGHQAAVCFYPTNSFMSIQRRSQVTNVHTYSCFFECISVFTLLNILKSSSPLKYSLQSQVN